MDYRYGSHTVCQIEYHFVGVTKYRYMVLSGEVAERVRELVRQACEAFEIRIVKGVVSKDHGQQSGTDHDTGAIESLLLAGSYPAWVGCYPSLSAATGRFRPVVNDRKSTRSGRADRQIG